VNNIFPINILNILTIISKKHFYYDNIDAFQANFK